MDNVISSPLARPPRDLREPIPLVSLSFNNILSNSIDLKISLLLLANYSLIYLIIFSINSNTN